MVGGDPKPAPAGWTAYHTEEAEMPKKKSHKPNEQKHATTANDFLWDMSFWVHSYLDDDEKHDVITRGRNKSWYVGVDQLVRFLRFLEEEDAMNEASLRMKRASSRYQEFVDRQKVAVA